ncbi:alginate O-acetyltransferase complex protein AlgF [Paraburkholderia unamae]|uniref:alginate O-acetyltransferase AlgF n=1 Tax=Paraburkholderia unamae TaxID=219649 RepID=UPI000DC60240|nr:alginate O-acetyltransferase AlgF [Paraburkholderia unamae]RAR54875.1 alginate O-acetyltransferase complex protein AlgF [Paraburkholderia unamae]
MPIRSPLRAFSLAAALLTLGPLVTFVAHVAHAAPADDMAHLYALPPDGSVYMRVVNPSDTPVAVQLGAGAKAETIGAKGRIGTDYRAIPGGALTLLVDGKPAGVAGALPRGGFVTLIVGQPGAGVQPVVDESPAADGLKAELSAYNLVPACTAAIRVVGGPAVFGALAYGARAARATNPVSASLDGACGAHVSAPQALPALKAGDRYSLFLVGTAGHPALVGMLNRTEPWHAH